MNEFELLSTLSDLPLTAVLLLALIFLWRRQELIEKKYQDKITLLQEKYETVLVDMGVLRGKVDSEINIDHKLDKILQSLIK